MNTKIEEQQEEVNLKFSDFKNLKNEVLVSNLINITRNEKKGEEGNSKTLQIPEDDEEMGESILIDEKHISSNMFKKLKTTIKLKELG